MAGPKRSTRAARTGSVVKPAKRSSSMVKAAKKQLSVAPTKIRVDFTSATTKSLEKLAAGKTKFTGRARAIVTTQAQAELKRRTGKVGPKSNVAGARKPPKVAGTKSANRGFEQAAMKPIASTTSAPKGESKRR